MSNKLPKLLAVFLAFVLVAGLLRSAVALLSLAQPTTNDIARQFNYGSVGLESTRGIPYWIWRVLPELFPEHLPRRQDGYGSIGLFWEAGEELPVGMSKKELGAVALVAPNCAFCHQGSYRLRPDEPSRLVTAGAGNMVSPQDFLRFLTNAAQDTRFTADVIMARIERLYDMPFLERLLYRYALIPFTQKALLEQARQNAWMDTRPAWGPGRIDPFNPVKFSNLKLSDDGTIGNSDMMPLWDLKKLDLARTQHPALHWDGLSTNLAETVLAGAIGDGLTSTYHNAVKETLERITNFARVNQPPPSPFRTDLPTDDPYHLEVAEVKAGKDIYQAHCAECHEPGGARYRTVISATELETDRHRIDMWTQEAANRYNKYEDDYNWGFKAFQKTNGYVATELTGLWLRGPYLHNGSVPTLRDLLQPPKQRPAKFYRGYDVVDPQNGGFVSQGEQAEKNGVLYDISTAGNANDGHCFGVNLSDAEKQNLLAYLKTL